MNEQALNGFTEVSSQLRVALSTHPVDDGALRAAVCAYVDAARAQGWPVERVIIELKRIAESEDGPVNRWSHATDRIDGQRVVARAVSWCVEHYFRGAPGRDA